MISPKIKILVTIFFISIVLPVSLLAKQEPPFQPGEIITYSIKKLGIKAGEATLEFRGPVQLEGQELLLVVFTAKGLTFYDEEKIYMEPKDFYPVRVERDVNILGKKEKIIEEYFQDEGIVKITKVGEDDSPERSIRKDGVLDNIYCFLYRYRSRGALSLGEKLVLNLPTQNMNIKVQQEVDLEAAGEIYEAVFLHSKENGYRIWIDRSPRRIPLRIDGAIKLGKAKMIMSDYQP